MPLTSRSYELAEEVVRDYVQRNFVSKGMCVDWAIHDSENEKGQRNLHFHLLATLRPLDENGKWAAKQPTIHLGAAANALERKGIRTERGDINREIRERNSRFEQAKEELEAAKQEVRSA